MSNKRLYCPLSMGSNKDTLDYCLTDQCAWWDAYTKTCATLAIAGNLQAIYDEKTRNQR